ncbi:kinase, partial [Thraustotheca clavata]
VWRATLNGETVAVKKLQPIRNSNSEIQDFIDKIDLTASFNCSSIITINGVIWTSPSNLKAVMEYMDLGDLRGYFVQYSPTVFTWQQKRQLLLSRLKSRNILVDSRKGAKLADFGVSKEATEQIMPRGVRTFRWMAPEVLLQKSCTIAADIYSFSAILSELDKHCIQYFDMKDPSTGTPVPNTVIIRDVMSGKLRPHFTDSCPEWVKLLADSCLQFDPEKRPKIGQIISLLNDAHD